MLQPSPRPTLSVVSPRCVWVGLSVCRTAHLFTAPTATQSMSFFRAQRVRTRTPACVLETPAGMICGLCVVTNDHIPHLFSPARRSPPKRIKPDVRCSVFCTPSRARARSTLKRTPRMARHPRHASVASRKRSFDFVDAAKGSRSGMRRAEAHQGAGRGAREDSTPRPSVRLC